MPHSTILRQLELLARDVLPAFAAENRGSSR
jgi:hypothetical protein